MTEAAIPRRNILVSDVDAKGNVTLWDHGPSDKPLEKLPGETDDAFKLRQEVAAAELKAWREKNPMPVMVMLPRAEAVVLLRGERHALEPLTVDEAAVQAEIKRIQEARAKADPQLAIDRQAAIVAVMAAQRAKAPAGKPDEKPGVSRLWRGPAQLERFPGETDEAYERRRKVAAETAGYKEFGP